MPKYHVEIVDAVAVRLEREGGEEADLIACDVDAGSEVQAIPQAWTHWDAAHDRGARPAFPRITIERIEEES
jgi:hypothetical protein